jgi:serine/threonine-protein kinase HipA
VEYAYHKLALAAGIAMKPCHLLEEGGRAHFMTRRFDRDAAGGKVHMQSLCAMSHYDFNAAGKHGYEQAMGIIQQLNLGHSALQEMFRRMAFNVVARNQDDHTRNIAFLMNPEGTWKLSPAYDVAWAYNAKGTWTNRHQMTVNGKRDHFKRTDLLAVAEAYHIKDAAGILDRVIEVVSRWRQTAMSCGVANDMVEAVAATHRLRLKGE